MKVHVWVELDIKRLATTKEVAEDLRLAIDHGLVFEEWDVISGPDAMEIDD